MKLSDLVRHRNVLDDIIPDDMETFIDKNTSPTIHEIESNVLPLPSIVEKLRQNQSSILSSIQDFKNTLDEAKIEIDRAIAAMEPTYFAKSYRLYYQMISETPDYILKRRLPLSKSDLEFIHGRVQAFSDWQHTAAVIRPGPEAWIDLIVGCDPLYLIDTDHDLFAPVKERFNRHYVSRLRFYTIRESEDRPMFQNLPDGQFSLVLIYNFFHYKPFELIKNYLAEIYGKLDQGGTVAFTFNDCDRYGAVEMAENNFMCYTPGRMIRGLCETLGYEIINSRTLDKAATWLEIRKPGRHVTYKGGQSLAKIFDKEQ